MISRFKHYDLVLNKPNFDSSLADLIIELEYLRKKEFTTTGHFKIFNQIKHLFHVLESINSARIEGNNTTILEYIETKIEENTIQHNTENSITEILNIENAMQFIEENIFDYPINETFISELHKIVVKNLPPPPLGDGDLHPGKYRKHSVKIKNSEHLPPDTFLIKPYMDELFDFINKKDYPKYDLLKTAIAHHRFVWIHPFGNGNGRTVRLFTYAMLLKNGLNLNSGRIINPTAIFCNDRNKYYDKLSNADLGTDEAILEWSEYVLNGLKHEIEKVDKLSEYEYLKTKILFPMIQLSLDNKFITDIESKILKTTVENKVLQNSDLKNIFKGKSTSEISRQIKKLISKKMLIPEEENTRKYIIMFDNNYLLRSMIYILGKEGFLTEKLS